MRIQHPLPLAQLGDALVAAQVLVDVGRARGVVDLVPVGLGLGGVGGGLFALLLLAAAALELLFFVVVVGVVDGGGPVGEGGARGGRVGGGVGGGCGGDGFGEGGGGFWFVGLFELGAADGLEAEGWTGGGLEMGKGELGGVGVPGSMCFFAGALSSLVKTTGSRDIEAELSDSRRFAYRDMPPRGGGGGADIVWLWWDGSVNGLSESQREMARKGRVWAQQWSVNVESASVTRLLNHRGPELIDCIEFRWGLSSCPGQSVDPPPAGCSRCTL